MDDQLLRRIVTDPRTMAGKPVVRGTRLTVGLILNLLGHGMRPEEVVAEYPGLTVEDIAACLLFAAQSVDDPLFVPLVEIA